LEHQISDIFQYASCKYRWYLSRVLNIDFENIHTVTGKIAHTRQRTGELRKNSLFEYEKFDLNVGDETLYGICDAVLFQVSNDGIIIDELGTDKSYKVFPMEYKSKKLSEPLKHPIHLQCVAQARCLEYMFKTKIDSYYVYYHKEHRREMLRISEADRNELTMIISEMDSFLLNSQIPERTSEEIFCIGCSCNEYCSINTSYLDKTFESYLQKEGN